MQFRSVAKSDSMHGTVDAVTFVAGRRLLDAIDQRLRIGFDLRPQNCERSVSARSVSQKIKGDATYRHVTPPPLTSHPRA
jgi:hypothetical protein